MNEINTEDTKKAEVLQNVKRAIDNKRNRLDSMEEDFEFFVGKQWTDEQVEDLRKKGVLALTINKIQPYVFLLSGIQRQNRTDYYAFPEGNEDSLLAEVTTRLLKNATKRSGLMMVNSEQFEDGVICGEGWMIPEIDYTHDLINGELKWKK